MVEKRAHERASRPSRISRVDAVTREVRGNRAYTSATRNPYDAPPEAYTGSETPDPPPALGTVARHEWDLRVGELRARGLSILDIAAEMNASEMSISDACTRHGFIKGKKT